MRIAFYSPIAKPSDTTPSGVSRVGALLIRALQTAGHIVDAPPLPSSFDGKGDAARQQHLFSECENAAINYLEAIALGKEPRPDLWFTYHVYYKSPDWIGPHVSRALGIPYLIAEGSHAPKRASGPWAFTHEATTKALQAADRLLAMTSFDRVCLEWIAKDRVRDLKPFIDTAPFAGSPSHRRAEPPRLLAVGMMRNERKLASYRLLADALRSLQSPVTLTIVGDGKHRPEVEQAFANSQHRIEFASAVDHEKLPGLMHSADLFTWPGVGEAYGLAFLEAQAAGLPVVATNDRGVPDVVVAEETALLSPTNDVKGYGRNITALIENETQRRKLADAARSFAVGERGLKIAARKLAAIIAELKP